MNREKDILTTHYEALHNISIPMDDDTVDWEDAIKDAEIWQERWYNKYIVLPIGTAYRWLWELPYCIKYFVQRGRRGWSDQDAWSIDTWLVDNLIPMLERLKNNKYGTPSSMFRKKDGVDKDGNSTDEAHRLAEQRWDNVLREIIYGLKCAKKIQDLDYDYKDKELTKKLTKSVQKSFTLIGKHLFNLWD